MVERLFIVLPRLWQLAPLLGEGTQIEQGFGQPPTVTTRLPQAQGCLPMAKRQILVTTLVLIFNQTQVVAHNGGARMVTPTLKLLYRPLESVTRAGEVLLAVR